MSIRVRPFFGRLLAPPLAVAGVWFLVGCESEDRKTGTMATKPPGAEAAQKASMEHLKSLMKVKKPVRR
jgi:hypothetical protein